jgi:hypothetical protein
MKQPCEKCYNLRATLNWAARVVITERGSGWILPINIDRLIYENFYPKEDKLGAWPVCPKCGEKVKMDDPNEVEEVFNLPDVNMKGAWVFLGGVFLAFILSLFVL